MIKFFGLDLKLKSLSITQMLISISAIVKVQVGEDVDNDGFVDLWV